MIRRPIAVLMSSMLRRWRIAVSRYCLATWLNSSWALMKSTTLFSPET